MSFVFLKKINQTAYVRKIFIISSWYLKSWQTSGFDLITKLKPHSFLYNILFHSIKFQVSKWKIVIISIKEIKTNLNISCKSKNFREFSGLFPIQDLMSKIQLFKVFKVFYFLLCWLLKIYGKYFGIPVNDLLFLEEKVKSIQTFSERLKTEISRDHLFSKVQSLVWAHKNKTIYLAWKFRTTNLCQKFIKWYPVGNDLNCF